MPPLPQAVQEYIFTAPDKTEEKFARTKVRVRTICGYDGVAMITLGIDCGTQSTKVIALDVESGEVLAEAQQQYELIDGLPDGAMEQHPEDWTAAADHAISEVAGQLGSRTREVTGLGVSGQQHGLVVLDDHDSVIRPAKLWCDTTTTAQCAEMTAQFGATEIIRMVGNAMLPGYTAPKILWLRQEEPDNWSRTKVILLPHDYLNFWLSGEKRMEYGDASGTALLNIETRQWEDAVVEYIDPSLREKLPELHSSAEAHGRLRPDLARRWGFPEETIVSAGGGDNMMGAIGTGNIHPGVVTASLGTSGTLYAFANEAILDSKSGEVAGFCDSTDHWLPLVCTMNVTLVTERFRELFKWNFGAYDTAAASVPAGSEGLLLLPYLAGERTPNLPDGTGVLHGVTPRNLTAPHLARAAMEGVTLGLAYGLSRFQELGLHPTEIRLTGGGSNSNFWRQLTADILGVDTICLKRGEGAALGAAIQAAWQTGKDDLRTLTDRLAEADEATRTSANPKHHEIYQELMSRAAQLRQALQSQELL